MRNPDGIRVQTLLRRDHDLVPLASVADAPPDLYYIEGAIDLAVNDRVILSKNEIDLVDQLWSYIITGLERTAAGQDFDTMLPDQPIRLSFHPIETDRTRVSVSSGSRWSRESTIRTALLLDGLLEGASIFFFHMDGLISDVNPGLFDYELERLHVLSSAIFRGKNE